MKLCVQLSPLQDIFGIDGAFASLREAGVDQVDFGLNRWTSPEQIRTGKLSKLDEPLEVMREDLKPYLEAAKRHGITIGQTHAPFPCWLPDKDVLERMTEVTKKSIILTNYLESRYCVVHPLYQIGKVQRLSPREEWELNKAFYSALIPTLKEYKVICCLENMFQPNAEHGYMASVCSEFDVAARWIDELNQIAGEELFGFCLDTGHVNVVHGNIRHALNALGKRIKVLHVHDNIGITDQHLSPFMGNINWEEFIQGMREIEYEGDFNFETFRVLRVFPPELAKSCLKLVADTGRYMIKRIKG